MRILNTLKYDMKFQFRYGFYFAYFLVALLYIGILKFIPIEWKEFAAIFFVYTDTSILGAGFIGAIILFEKDQNTLESIFVTPMRLWEYIFSKLISLTILALGTSILILTATFGLDYNIFILILEVILSSVLFTLLGIIMVSYVKTINGFFMLFIATVPIFLPPIIYHLGIYSSVIFYALPSQGLMKMIKMSFYDSYSKKILLVNIIYVLGWIWLLYKIALNRFYKNVILKVGDGK